MPAPSSPSNITSVGTLSSLAVGAITSTASSTITTADNLAQLTLISTDADANEGPILNLYRNSVNPADDDVIGTIKFDGEDSAGNQQTYSKIYSAIMQETSGTEDSNLYFNITKAGTERSALRLDRVAAVFNEDSQDIDFRVESDGNANMLFVDGGENKVGIGNATPGSSHANANLLVVGSGSAGGIGLWNGANAGGYYFSRDNANNTDAYDGGMSYDGSRNLKFHTNAGATRMTIDGSGNVDIAGALDVNNLTIATAQGSDGQVLTSTGSGVGWEDAGGGAVSAINNATANELVTIGSTTTELDSEANMTYDDTNGLTITGDFDHGFKVEQSAGHDRHIRIFHGSHGYIRNGEGSLNINSDGAVNIKDGDNNSGANFICTVAGATQLGYNKSIKLATTSGGVVVTGSLTTSDLILSNASQGANDFDGTTGSWQIQEGSDDLFIMNKLTGKKYKFKLEEI